jgi:hypothetical protein
MCSQAEKLGSKFRCWKNPDITARTMGAIPFCNDFAQQAICAQKINEGISRLYFTGKHTLHVSSDPITPDFLKNPNSRTKFPR